MPRLVTNYGIGLLALAASVALRWLLDPLLGDSVPFITVFGAVAIAAWVGGIGVGAVVAILGFATCAALFEPRLSLNFLDARLAVQLAAFLFTSAIIIGLCAAMRRARKRAETEHETLRVTFQSMGDAVICTDADGGIVALNPIAENLTGWTRETAIGRPLQDVFKIIDERTRATAPNPADRALREGVVTGLANHTLLIRRDGTECAIDDSAAPIRDPEGTVIGCVLTFRDISERRALEHKSASRVAASLFLASIVRSSRDAIISKDLDGIIQSWNAAAERMFGYTAEEAIGRHIALLIPRDRLKEEDHIISRMRAGERIDHFETVRLRAGGEPLHVSLTISPIEDERGQVVGASKIARDITERVQTEAALRARNERLRLLSEAAETLLSDAEPKAMLDDLLTRLKPFLGLDAYLHYAVDPEDGCLRLAASLGLAESMLPELDRLRFDEGICGQVASRRSPLVVPHLQRSSDVATRLLRTMGFRAYVCYPVLSDGELLGTLAFATCTRDTFDDDEIEFLETVSSYVSIAYRRLHLTTQLRLADRRKDEFLATLAHELRNPLAPLANAFQAMKHADADAAVFDEACKTVERQLAQLVRLVDDLLDVSRISRNVIVLRNQPVTLDSILKDALETCRPLADAARLRVELHGADESILLNADPVRLTQVFANLLNNACKYTPPGGHIELSSRREGMRVRVTVRDSGRGMSPQVLGGIFDMFFQGDDPGDHPHGGLGIGLSLARRLAELHGGTISARSEGPGCGSEFVVELPLAPAEVRVRSARAVASLTPGTSRRVLVVDDNADGARSLAMLLEMFGHETAVAFDGLGAVEEARRFEPDVVLLDIGMPGLNGYDTCRRLRQDWGDELTIVAVTGWSQDAERDNARSAGFDHHLVKPIDFASLDSILRESPVVQ